ncbi:conserved hypothetical protein [Xenorhabdus nematophila F1]|uniref:Uncharacterized protein n=1 Tax=Xenorhabdus nematophila (strain ATCC 19061 / DSM 3370 / CCUG 14189 / LMG 1036 / NCIMB 9965 / AN6) TaxID=406817 RepID=D3VCT6_XENNA|nr:hypothetical protein XNC1_4096 [Xenorhabdus nematophila ATCC 19061]CCW30705.1 conserved hypothetical protein [Xenorhabdus nematophila F1]
MLLVMVMDYISGLGLRRYLSIRALPVSNKKASAETDAFRFISKLVD